MRFGLFPALIFILLLPLAVSAQTLDGPGSIGASFTLSATPQYPSPFGTTMLSFLSSSLDLTSATLTVSTNGKNIYQGSVQPVSVPLGKAGSVTNIVAKISVRDTDYTQTLRIQPQDVSLVAEPVSSAPPLYPGKSLVPLEGSIRVVAIANLKNANGATINPSTLSYAWTVDGAKIANSSGIGKETIIVASPLRYRARTVSIVVTSPDGSQVGGASLSLSPQEPSLRLYENDPLLGIRFERALSVKYSIADAELTLYAAPFSLPMTGNAPFIQWFLNGAAAQTGNSITLRPSGSGRGSASLSLTASSGSYAQAAMNLSIIFGAQSSANFFGL